MTDPIKLPPMPVPTLIADSPAGHTAAYSPAQLRARDLEVARVVLEAAAEAAELWHANGIEVEIARDIRALEVSHG